MLLDRYSVLRAALVAGTLAAPVAAKAQTSTGPVGGIVSITGSAVHGDMTAVYTGGSSVVGSAVGAGNVSNPYGGYTAGTIRTVAPAMASGGIVNIQNSVARGNIAAVGTSDSTLSGSTTGYNNLADAVGQVTQLTITARGLKVDSLGIVQINNSVLAAGDISAVGTSGSLIIDSANGAANHTGNYGGYDSITAAYHSAVPAVSGSAYVTGSFLPASNITVTATDGSVISQSAQGYNDRQNSVGSVVKITAKLLGLQK